MATDPNSDPSTSAFDPLADPYRFLGVDPTTTDSAVDMAFHAARQNEAASQAALADAYAAIKDPSRRLQAELAYPLDCPADLLDLFRAETAPSSIVEVLQIADRFPALTRTHFVARSAIRLGLSGKLLLALVDGHAAIEAIEIYQTLQKVRHQAGYPAPSLMSVRNGLDDLLGAHVKFVISRADSAEALAGALLDAKRSIEITHDHARLEVFSTFLTTSQARIGEALAKAQDDIEAACNALRHHPDDSDAIKRLAEGCDAFAYFSEAVRRPEFAGRLSDEEIVVWERLGSLLSSLAHEHHFVSAQAVMDTVIETLGPFAAPHEKALALRSQLQETINQIRGEPDRIENGRDKGASPEQGQRRYGLIISLGLFALVAVLIGSAFLFWHASDTPSAAAVASKDPPPGRAEPESLPTAATGQRYPREYVRYCLFQEQRLRVVKQHVQSQEDIRAYNALAADWNSRCADYFYQDEDLRVVKDEVTSKQKMLEADAQRILSTWPWRPPIGQPPVK